MPGNGYLTSGTRAASASGSFRSGQQYAFLRIGPRYFPGVDNPYMPAPSIDVSPDGPVFPPRIPGTRQGDGPSRLPKIPPWLEPVSPDEFGDPTESEDRQEGPDGYDEMTDPGPPFFVSQPEIPVGYPATDWTLCPTPPGNACATGGWTVINYMTGYDGGTSCATFGSCNWENTESGGAFNIGSSIPDTAGRVYEFLKLRTPGGSPYPGHWLNRQWVGGSHDLLPHYRPEVTPAKYAPLPDLFPDEEPDQNEKTEAETQPQYEIVNPGNAWIEFAYGQYWLPGSYVGTWPWFPAVRPVSPRPRVIPYPRPRPDLDPDRPRPPDPRPDPNRLKPAVAFVALAGKRMRRHRLVRLPHPPGRRVRELKLLMRAAQKILRAVNKITEGCDAIEAFYDAIPDREKRRDETLAMAKQRAAVKRHGGWNPKFRKVKPPCHEQALQAVAHMKRVGLNDTKYFNNAFANLLKNEIEDQAIGRTAKGASKLSRQAGRPVGFQAGPAL